VKNENDINVNSSTMTSFFYWIKSVIITAINVWDFRGRYSWWHFYDQSKTRVRFTWSYLLGAWVWHGVHGAQYWEVNRTENLKRFSSCPTSSACYPGTLHYIYRDLEFEFRSSHLFTLKIKFLVIRLLTKKKYSSSSLFILEKCFFICIFTDIHRFFTYLSTLQKNIKFI
jgi:hypothetical protein